MTARIRMDGVASDTLIPTPPTGKASLFYNNVSKVYRAKLDDGTVITLSSDPEFIQDTVGAMFQDSATIDFTYNDAGGVAFVEVIQSALDTTLIPNTPSGNLTATTVQAALNELQGDIDNININAVLKSDYTPAHSILVQQSGTGSPEALQVSNNTLVGRLSGGGSQINDLSATQVRELLSVDNVDNTSDLDKPISTATQGALDLKVSSDTTGVTGADQVTNMISLTQAEYDAIVTKSASTFYLITDAI